MNKKRIFCALTGTLTLPCPHRAQWLKRVLFFIKNFLWGSDPSLGLLSMPVKFNTRRLEKYKRLRNWSHNVRAAVLWEQIANKKIISEHGEDGACYSWLESSGEHLCRFDPAARCRLTGTFAEVLKQLVWSETWPKPWLCVCVEICFWEQLTPDLHQMQIRPVCAATVLGLATHTKCVENGVRLLEPQD